MSTYFLNPLRGLLIITILSSLLKYSLPVSQPSSLLFDFIEFSFAASDIYLIIKYLPATCNVYFMAQSAPLRRSMH